MERYLLELERLMDLFSRLINMTTLETLRYLGEYRLSVPQLRALRFLKQHEDCLVGDLANGLAISYPAASKLINRLIDRGMTQRRDDEADRRNTRLRVTLKGGKVLEIIEEKRRREIVQIFWKLEGDEQRFLTQGLKRFLEAALSDETIIDKVCLHCGTEHFDDCLINKLNLTRAGDKLRKIWKNRESKFSLGENGAR
ncbi:MAG: MarR family winged helix-turn-helix transcriptional regulator [bacterium]